ncbi:hypothetical protein [Dolosicoccus paucivorans]|uniref:hypothetical protein n=1 Tax=Dolosicoccus paucivorans TaxID=84521 RepID=UPI0008811973|nr:hypothetical protein [Dolosicoccus paucivorans]SDI71351.1 hypothetical protein SAMN04487994_103711 [Dolosicoccus paucivorans]
MTEATFTKDFQEGLRDDKNFTATKEEKTATDLSNELQGFERYEDILEMNGTFEYRNTSDHDLESENYVNEDTGVVDGKFVAGKLQKITYNYYLQVPSVETGKFVEHHEYYDVEKNFEGVETSRELNQEKTNSVTGITSEGPEEETYHSALQEGDGYKVNKEKTETKLIVEPKFDEDGTLQGNE